MVNLSPSTTSMRICLEGSEEGRVLIVGRDGTLQAEYSTSVGERDEEERFVLDLATWAAWVGMEIDPYTLDMYSVPEIVSRCLHEMTFFGFDENSVATKREGILRAIAALENAAGPEQMTFLHEIVHRSPGGNCLPQDVRG